MATTDWTSGVEVRRHNGQCAYGQWLDIDDEEVPSWVDALVADQIVEEDLDEGRVEQGGSIWLWRKGD